MAGRGDHRDVWSFLNCGVVGLDSLESEEELGAQR